MNICNLSYPLWEGLCRYNTVNHDGDLHSLWRYGTDAAGELLSLEQLQCNHLNSQDSPFVRSKYRCL